jgi:protein-tyrosine phosphatase
MNLVDLSCHVLDGTGCGPESYAESLEMCRAAAAEGVSLIVATPRWAPGSLEPPLPLDECHRKVVRLEDELGGVVSLKLGFLLPFSMDLPELVDRFGAEIALGGKRHLLISLSSQHTLDDAGHVWEALVARGYTPVVAQPECSPVLRRNPEWVARWVAQGVKLQINAASVAGAYGREVRNAAIALLRAHDENAFVASNSRGPGDRGRTLGSVREDLRNQLGVHRANRFLRDAPSAAIGGRELLSREGAQKGAGRLPALLNALKLPKSLRRVS